MYKNFKISAILLMGGRGERFGSKSPKQFHLLSGKKIYLHTLEKFNDLNIFDEIILVCPKEWIKTVEKETADYKNIKVVEGGSSRQESSYFGLISCEYKDFVLIHDAVRCFVSKEIILNNIKAVFKYKAVDTCIESKDTLVERKNDFIQNIPNRDNFLRGQTPQSFEYDLILRAHKKALKNNLKNSFDDCSLLIKDSKVHIIKGEENNIKITTQLDLFLAEQLFRLNNTKIKPQKLSLKGKTYILIGASGDIGKEIKKEIEKEKAFVISLSKTSQNKIDLRDKKTIEKAFKSIYKKYGKVDGLINSAGIFIVKPLAKIASREIDELLDVNLKGLIYSCKFAKIKNQGHIINIASSSFTRGRKNYGIYSSSKAAVVNFTQALAEEMSNLNINSIVPSRAKTKMRSKYFPNEDPNLLLKPNKIAKEIVLILKSNLTGNIIEIKK